MSGFAEWRVVCLDSIELKPDPLVFGNQAEWRDWLEMNHNRMVEVWLLIRKAGSRGGGLPLDMAVDEALCFGWIDGKMRSKDSKGYILRFSPRRPESLWSIKNRERAERLIKEGRMAESGLACVRRSQESGRWQSAYTSRVEPELPEDLRVALQADTAAGVGYQGWPNNMKLQAVMWIIQAKRTQTRQRRVSKVVACAREGRNFP